MPPSIPNTAGRPSSLPQQIPPQVTKLGTVTVVDESGKKIGTGDVTMDVNYWLFFYNIAHQVLTAAGAPLPVTNNASSITLADSDAVPPNPQPSTVIDWMSPI